MRQFDRPSGVLRVRPRLDAKPWGGDRLAAFGFSLPGGEPLGEALLSHGDALVEVGGATMTLAEAVAANPDAYLGPDGARATAGGALLPVLAKVIDGRDDLSVQVHPDDALAREQGEATGKTEAWHVLDAEPGAVLYLGLADDVAPDDFFAAARRGEPVATMLRTVPAVPGSTVVLPAGAVHALGRGVVLYEIQQPSNTTYRLWDWGRVGPDGRSRDLHHDLGQRAARAELRPERRPPLVIAGGAGARRELLAATRSFALERLVLFGGGAVDFAPVGSPQVLTCVAGACHLVCDGDAERLAPGGTVIVPAGAGGTLASADGATVMRGWVPDLWRDVVGPARAAGHPDAAIAELAGELDDVRSALGPTPEPSGGRC